MESIDLGKKFDVAIWNFMNDYKMKKRQAQELADKFDLVRTGEKVTLFMRIISEPEFDRDDLKSVYSKEELERLCRKIGVKSSGTKDELWNRIIKNLNLPSRKKKSLTKKKTKKKEETKIIPEPKEISLMNSIIQLVQKWTPKRRYRTEGEYQTDLRSLLEYKHNLNVSVESGPNQADILVEDSIPIEIKKNPSRSDFDRLSGQIDRQIDSFGNLIIVICRLEASDLYNEYKRYSERKYSSEQLIWIVK